MTSSPPSPTVGVLLVNLGTPDAPTPKAVRTYLAEFLHDKRVVEIPRMIWCPILHGIILPFRPYATAKNYAKIWDKAQNMSPLAIHTRDQAIALQQKLPQARVDWAMRYGNPSVGSRIDAMKDAGVEKILIVPLYPQYAAATTASVTDAVAKHIKKRRAVPAIRFAPSFPAHPDYIEAMAQITNAHLGALDWQPDHVVISFHGLPKRCVDQGDPYQAECIATAEALRAKMGWSEEFAPIAYQSKFGREEWLTPATDATIDALAQKGAKRVAAIMPGFMADCIETLEEIDLEARAEFLAAGGEAFTSIPCLNSAPPTITFLENFCRQELQGWL